MILTKNLKFLILLLFVTALFAACNKEEIATSEDYTQQNAFENENDPESNPDDDDEYDDDDYDDDYDDHHDCEDDDFNEFTDCVEFVFPISITFPDSTEITAADEDELEDLLFAWYDENPESEEDPTLIYPISVILGDGSESTINNDEEFEAAVLECEIREFVEDFADNECFTVNFPISFELEDGTIHTVISAEEAIGIILPFYIANPESDDPELLFPIELTLADGTTVTVNDYDELEEIEEDCEY